MSIDLEIHYIAILIVIYLAIVWNKSTLVHRAIHFTFIVYCMMLLKVTFFPIQILPAEYAIPPGNNNFVPLESLMRSFRSEVPGVALLQIGGNLLLLLPLGFYVSLLWKRINTIPRVLLFGFGVSLFIECLQLVLTQMIGQDYRRFDIDDLLLNTIGYTTGYLILKLSAPVVGTLVNLDHLKRENNTQEIQYLQRL